MKKSYKDNVKKNVLNQTNSYEFVNENIYVKIKYSSVLVFLSIY